MQIDQTTFELFIKKKKKFLKNCKRIVTKRLESIFNFDIQSQSHVNFKHMRSRQI